VAKPMGAVSVFTNGELHPSTTVKAAFRDISTTRFTLMGDSPGHSRESEACNPEERKDPNLSLVQTPHNLDDGGWFEGAVGVRCDSGTCTGRDKSKAWRVLFIIFRINHPNSPHHCAPTSTGRCSKSL